MSRRRKTGLAFVLLPVLLVTSLILTGLILVYRPLPTIDGEYRLLGIDQRAEVDRDSYGVPHILAQNVHDLFYLQGYVTAQDRLFQMELYRRAGTGRRPRSGHMPTASTSSSSSTGSPCLSSS
ncbi:MAG: penicillin acylase family protein [Chloroflexi bacterium]|nr:MAG: penicillin acylase family protein [Chloroflexota bacterium]